MLEASVETGCKTFFLGSLAEKSEQALDDLGVLGLVRSINAILPHAIVLRQINGLAPLLVTTVHVGRNSSEFQQLVTRKFRGQRNHVEIGEIVDRLAKGFVVFIVNIQLVQGFVYLADIVLLHRLQVLLANLQSPVSSSTKLADNAGVVDIFFHYFHEAREKSRVHAEVVANCLVHELGVADFGDRVQEKIVVPRICSFHHRLNSAVVLLVLHVQINSRLVKTSAFASSDNL
mmetsp:Transcript_5973/g.11985  ORF Transcript_5973/g.11985 Transcript_5973/m.11985 type:complete len:232 (+) Transcript_5973:515-1210(+)